MFWYMMIIIMERLIETMMETKTLLTELDPHNHLQKVQMCRISLHLSNRKVFLKKKDGHVLLYVYIKNLTEAGDFGAIWTDLFGVISGI